MIFGATRAKLSGREAAGKNWIDLPPHSLFRVFGMTILAPQGPFRVFGTAVGAAQRPFRLSGTGFSPPKWVFRVFGMGISSPKQAFRLFRIGFSPLFRLFANEQDWDCLFLCTGTFWLPPLRSPGRRGVSESRTTESARGGSPNLNLAPYRRWEGSPSFAIRALPGPLSCALTDPRLRLVSRSASGWRVGKPPLFKPRMRQRGSEFS